MTRNFIILILIIGFTTLTNLVCWADAVYFDSNKVEGIIVEETDSFIVIESSIGKITISKDKITHIERTSPEENFFNQGNYYFKQKRYDAAIDYYLKALEINPEYSKAKEALAKAKEAKEEIDLKQKLELERIKKAREEKKEKLEKRIGMVVDEVDGTFKVVHIVENSPSDKAQVKLYDRIIIIDDSLTKSMTLEKVWEKLSAKKPIALTIEREANILRKRIEYKKRTFVGIGIFLDIDDKGSFISSVIEGESASEAGIVAGDRIIKVDGESTEGLILDEVAELIGDGELSTINIVVRRDVKIE